LLKLELLFLLLAVSVGFTLAYGDHPDPVELTFNQEEYEFGDTMIITGTLPEPWEDIENCETKAAIDPDIFPNESTTNIDENGQFSFTYYLNSSELHLRPFSAYSIFTTHYESDLRPGYCIDIRHETIKYFNSTLNSDHYSTLLQHMKDIPIVNSTAQSNLEAMNTMHDDMNLMHDEMNLMHDDMTFLDTKITSLNNTIISLIANVTSIQTDLEILIALVEELIEQQPPLPLDAPIIISLTADDPDDSDSIPSVDDTITIKFDSDTNEAGGNGVQTKSEVNNLFTFTENISQAYKGQWITADTFIITINSINNAEMVIGNTTVTPAQITLILPADNNPENYSYETSPPLTGDWGEP